MKTDIEKLAREFSQYNDEYTGSLYNKGLYEGYMKGFRDSQKTSLEDNADKMLECVKYGFDFRANTAFPEHPFEQECINNAKQWLIAKFKIKNIWKKK